MALQFRPFTLNDGDFVASKDDSESLGSGEVGEIAIAEVGSAGDGQLTNYEAVQLGQPAAATGGDNQGNEPFIKLADNAAADIADTADWGFAARRKGDIGGGAQGEVTGFRTHRNQDNADARVRTSMPPQEPVVRSGRVLQLLARDETGSLTVSLADSTFQVPSLGGQ